MTDCKIYTSYRELPASWDDFSGHDIFLQSRYLKAMEKASPSNISWYYAAVYHNDELSGIAVIQRVQLYLKDMFRRADSSWIKELFRNVISRVLRGNVLVIGNLTQTGQHGIYFDTERIDPGSFLESLFKGIDNITAAIRAKEGKRIRLILCKDYFETDPVHEETQFFKSQALHRVVVQPNMMMSVRPHWKTIRDYYQDLNKKYKRHFNRARRKSALLHSRELDLEDIKDLGPILYTLYKNVCDNASFNTFILPNGHFLSLKEQLGEDFRVFGYYHDDRLIGFNTLILNDTDLETYFLGYDQEHQNAHQLYLNMLYDMADYAIRHGFKTIVYARTAMEIKSSVGAQAHTMMMYMKHTNGLANAILKLVFSLMNPSQNWKERHPFKTEPPSP